MKLLPRISTLFLVLYLIYTPKASAQTGHLNCTGDILLSTQAEVDAFDCDSIAGSLTVNGPDITNLDGLQGLIQVGGNLTISPGMLANLQGLRNLRGVGGSLEITRQSALRNLDGLESLVSIGQDLILSNLTNVSNVRGLIGLKEIPGELSIVNISRLFSFRGLDSLRRVGGDFEANAGMVNTNGVEKLEEIGGRLTIRSQNLTTLSGFANLKRIGEGIVLEGNFALLTLDGFQKLETLGGSFDLRTNPNLRTLDALPELREVGGNLNLPFRNLGNLEKLQKVGGVLRLSSIRQVSQNPPTFCSFSRFPRFLKGKLRFPPTSLSSGRAS
ncbi:MAG: hypothetical protein AAFU64_12440, partial [Bacteroidota bacterium]